VVRRQRKVVMLTKELKNKLMNLLECCSDVGYQV
jgi:hypothetical protein